MDVFYDGTRTPVDEPEPCCPVDVIWSLLWPYIANENSDEDYSAEMAERLCEEVLPKVWDCVLDEVAQLEHWALKLKRHEKNIAGALEKFTRKEVEESE